MTAAEILSDVQENIAQASTLTSTTFARLLRRALKILSTAENVLTAEATISLSDGDKTMDYPDNLKAIDKVVLTDTDGDDGDPLTEMDWKEYLERMEDFDASSGEDEPEYYVDHNRKIYFWRPADAAFTGTLYYYRYHPDSVATILFPDEWRGAIEALSTWLTARRLGRSRYMNIWGGPTEAQATAFAIGQLHGQQKQPANFVAYND